MFLLCLLDGKSKDLLTMKQNEVEWIEYRSTMKDVIERSKLPSRIFYDLRGNHDSFGVPTSGGDYDFYQKYSINAKSGRQGRVQSVTLEVSVCASIHDCTSATCHLECKHYIASYFFSIFFL
jgi:hypothetical protein